METTEKIDVRELSIGDFVCAVSGTRETPPMRVVGLGEDWVNLEIDPEQGDPFEYEPSEIRGIPITADVLEKSGFTHDKWSRNIWLHEDKDSEVVYYIEGNKVEITTNNCKMNLVCKSVGVLQHAMRLAKIEKDITL